MSPLDERDHELSMRISRRARRPEDNIGMRDLIVHRLSDTHKAVARISFRDKAISVYCEPCREWAKFTEDDDFPTEWQCPMCKREYGMEFAVMEELE